MIYMLYTYLSDKSIVIYIIKVLEVIIIICFQNIFQGLQDQDAQNT